jgi:DNA processing protein
MQNSLKYNELSPDEHVFTSLLEYIPLKPKMLYYIGKLPEKRMPTVALVGSRKPTKYGLDIAFNWARELAERGVVVISGLALGIDAAAHRGALVATVDTPSTIAVLGSPIDKISPSVNYQLGQQIMQNGAIISEYPPGAVTYPSDFLHRNRLIAGLADAVIVVEANERSGSLATARHAFKQGRVVFAVPADITRPLAAGCNLLLKQGARAATEVADVLTVVAPELLPRKPKKARRGQAVGLAEMLYEGWATERILAALQIDVAELGRRKTALELTGEI